MTDLDKFEALLNDIGIKYSISEFEHRTEITIDSSFVDGGYGSIVAINFDPYGKFYKFEAWGE